MSSQNNLATNQFRRTALAIGLGLSLGLMSAGVLAQDAQSGQAADQGQAGFERAHMRHGEATRR